MSNYDKKKLDRVASLWDNQNTKKENPLPVQFLKTEPTRFFTGESYPRSPEEYRTVILSESYSSGTYGMSYVDVNHNDVDPQSRLQSLCDKAEIGKGDSDRHLLTLFSIALSSHSRNILELGVRNGDTTLPLLMAAKINSGLVDSVDISDTEFKCPEDLKRFWRFNKSDAIKYLEECVFKGRKFDLIYLDDWHEYSHVKKELELIDQLVTPSSIILVHDCMYSTGGSPYYHIDLTLPKENQWGQGGPARAVQELNPQFWEFATLPYNNGLTLLRKKYSSKY